MTRAEVRKLLKDTPLQSWPKIPGWVCITCKEVAREHPKAVHHPGGLMIAGCAKCGRTSTALTHHFRPALCTWCKCRSSRHVRPPTDQLVDALQCKGCGAVCLASSLEPWE